MSNLSGTKCRDALRALQSFGYEEKRRKGSHVSLRCEGRPPLTFPDQGGKDINAFTLRGILKTAGISEDDFISRLYFISRL